MARVVSVSNVRQSVEGDLIACRESSAPPLAHLAGLRRLPTNDGRFALGLDPGRPALKGGPGILEVAMLADLALGGVIRSEVGVAVQLPTISMTLQVDSDRLADTRWAHAERTTRCDRTVSARSRLYTDEGDVVGDAQGVFALPRLPYEGPGRSMPWDVLGASGPDARSLASTDLSPSDAALADDIVAHSVGGSQQAFGSSLIAAQLTTSSEQVSFLPVEVMANRLGHVQGGALFSAAVVAGAQAGDFPEGSLATATIAFLNPAALDGPINVHVAILKAGGRSLVADIRLEQHRRTCCQISAVYRR